jgi:hypothetical protein
VSTPTVSTTTTNGTPVNRIAGTTKGKPNKPTKMDRLHAALVAIDRAIQAANHVTNDFDDVLPIENTVGVSDSLQGVWLRLFNETARLYGLEVIAAARLYPE